MFDYYIIYGEINIKKKINKHIIILGIIFFLTTMVFFPTINSQLVDNKAIININQASKISRDNYELLIICPDYFEKIVRPLVSHKHKYDIETYLATLDEIYSHPESKIGRDEAEKIKFFIKHALDDWQIKYVLLIGGKVGQLNRWHMPVRYIHLGNSWEPEILSDLYFADVYDKNGDFSSWDSDGDGKFCEWYYDGQPEDVLIDLIPEVSIGRLPCRNKIEVYIMVNKIINYEKSYQKDKSWFDRFIVAAGDTYPELHNPKWVGYEGEIYGDFAIENMSDFNPIKLYTSDGSLIDSKDISNPLNKGCGFIYFVGHGCPMLWANNLPNSTERADPFSITDINMLRNLRKLPVCVVSGCHNSQFDVDIFNYFDELKRKRAEYPLECWGWLITRKAIGGSIATIGCTALGHTKEDKVSFAGGINELEVSFFDHYSNNNLEILGDAWAAAIKWYIDTYPVDWNQELTNDNWVDIQVTSTWVLFGDPSLKIGGYQ
jgi:hypothetical protein